MPYLAEFDLSLVASGGSSVASAQGLFVLEFGGSACAGFTNAARIVTSIVTPEGDRLVTDTRTSTFEAPDGDMEFSGETLAEGATIEAAAGRAERTPDGVRVALDDPGAEPFLLPGAPVFPTEQVLRVLEAANQGKRFLAMDLYDGSADGTLVYETATVIGEEQRQGEESFGPESGIDPAAFAGLRFWPLTISYFERRAEPADSTPDFVLSFDVFENGTGRDFVIDYGDFALSGTLRRFELLPADDCD